MHFCVRYYALPLRFFVGVFLASVAFSATAGEIVFYEFAGLVGKQISMRTLTTNFESIGFNDRANSLVVRSGTWLVCTDAEFRGACAIFVRGEYRLLDSRYANQISSAREVETYGGANGVPGNDYGSGNRAAIEFFDQRDFNGQSMLLQSDAENFEPLGFNDRAVSVVVSGGAGVVWELCTDADYRGTCRRFGAGRYAELGVGLAREISSARILGIDQTNLAPVGAVVDRNANVGNLVLYDADGFLGRGVSIASDIANLENVGFNDAAQSIFIERGTWEFCTNAYFRGTCRVLGPGYYRRLDSEFHRTISSIRSSTGIPAGMPGRVGGGHNPGDGADLVIYDRGNFTGRSFSTRTDVNNLALKEFNDRAASLIIHSGRWELCTDANYAGRCAVFGPGRYDNLRDLNNRLSSMRRIN